MYNKLLIIIILTIVTLGVPNQVNAHSLKTDGSIGAVMHVDPEDDPIVGKQSSFYFEFKDTNKTFDPKNCECAFSVLQNGKVLYSQPMFEDAADPSLSHSSASYFFADRGVYTIRLTGQPKSGTSFSPFTLDFDLRVTRVASTANTTSEPNWITERLSIIIGGIVGLAIVGFVLFKSRKHEK